MPNARRACRPASPPAPRLPHSPRSGPLRPRTSLWAGAFRHRVTTAPAGRRRRREQAPGRRRRRPRRREKGPASRAGPGRAAPHAPGEGFCKCCSSSASSSRNSNQEVCGGVQGRLEVAASRSAASALMAAVRPEGSPATPSHVLQQDGRRHRPLRAGGGRAHARPRPAAQSPGRYGSAGGRALRLRPRPPRRGGKMGVAAQPGGRGLPAAEGCVALPRPPSLPLLLLLNEGSVQNILRFCDL